MIIYLIRHGRQSSKLCNVDVNLSEAGRKQADLLGKRLKHMNITKLYSSNLLRAVETADICNRYLHLEHGIIPELEEIHFGKLQGMSDEEIAKAFEELKHRQSLMTDDIPFPGGECHSQVAARAVPVLFNMAKVHDSDEHIAIVTHGGTIRSVVANMLGMDMAKTRLLAANLENTSITELKFDYTHQRFTIERLNDYSHLDEYPELLRAYWSEEVQGE